LEQRAVIDNSGKRRSLTGVPWRALRRLAGSSSAVRPWRSGGYFGIAFISACVLVVFGWMGLIQPRGLDWFTSTGGNPDGSISYKSVLAEETLAYPPTLVMEWEEVDGAVRRLEVDRTSLKAFVVARMNAIDRDREILREIGARYLRARVDASFDRMKQRIHTYTTWMYGWAASYVKAYMLVGRGFWKSVNLVAEGKFDTLSGDLEADMTTFIMTEFSETVTKPEESDAEIVSAWRETLIFVDEEWTRMRDRSTLAFRAFVANQNMQGRMTQEISASNPVTKPRPRPGLLTAGNVDADSGLEIFAGAPAGEALVEQEVVDGIVSRSVRPWVSRVVGITLQSMAAGTAAATTGAIVPVVGSGAGFVIGVTTFLAYHWAFDFVLNEVDEGLNRQNIEATLKAAIDNIRVSVNQRLVARLENQIDSAFAVANGMTSSDRPPLGMDLVVRLRVVDSL
jgi:hypothetical protein